MVEEESLRGVTSNPAIFEKAILGSHDYDEQLGQLAEAGGDARGIYQRDGRSGTSRRPATSCGPSATRRTATTATSRSRSTPTSPSTPSARSPRRASTGRRVDRPNLMIKIPGTRRGRPGDRGADLRGAQHQRHAAVRRRGLRRGSPRPSSAASSAATPRARTSTSTPSRRSSSRAWTPRSTSAWRRSAARTCRAGPAWPTPAPPTGASRRSSTASASPRCARPARPCSARCGRRPASRTRAYPDTMYVDGLVAPARRSTRCRWPRCSRRPSTARSPGRPADLDPADDLERAGRGGHRPRRRHRQAAARRHRRVRHADGEAAGAASSPSARRSSPRARRRSSPRCPTSSSRRIAARIKEARGGRGRAADLAQGPDAVGRGRPARGGRPARLADRHRRASQDAVDDLEAFAARGRATRA